MLETVATALKARLEGLDLFNVVEQGFSRRVLSAPPSAVCFLVEDGRVKESPYVQRELVWNVALMVSFLEPEKAQTTMNGLIDAVRGALVEWIPVPAGAKPCVVGPIRFEAVEDTLLIYTVRVTMEVIPEMIA